MRGLHGVSAIALGAVLSMLGACGGGGSGAPQAVAKPASTPTTTPKTAALVGVGTTGYAGVQGMFDVDYGGGLVINYTFLETGEYFGIDYYNGPLGLSHGALTSTGSTVSTTQAGYYNTGQSPGNGGALQIGSANGTYTAPALAFHVKGTVIDVSGSATGPKTYSATDATTLYDNPVSLATLAGSYDGFLLKLGKGVPTVIREQFTGLTLAADGTYTAVVGSCTFSGTMAQHGSTAAFDATATVSGSGCSIAGEHKGIVAPQKISAAETILGFQLYGPPDPTQTAPTNAFMLYVTKF